MPEAAALQTDLARAHTRFARAALAIYLGSALIALGVMVAFLFADLAQEKEQLLANLQTEVGTREAYLRRHLTLLVQELRRMALRSEVDPLDQNQSPEQRLLQLAHEGSTFFNLGVAIVNHEGVVTSTVPEQFLAIGQSLANESWFEHVRVRHELAIVPVTRSPEEATLYLVTPILRNGRFDGAFVGALDLARGSPNALGEFGALVEPLLATRHGKVIFPALAPSYVNEPQWRGLFATQSDTPTVTKVMLGGLPLVIAQQEVHGTDLVLLLTANEAKLFEAATTRIQERLAVAFSLAALPFIALVLLLRRSLRVFRASEERFVREERLRRVGEASNLIAHEVKNALNGIRMATELACDGPSTRTQGQERALQELRHEIQRLANFTGELMTFSKGITVRSNRFALREFIAKVVSLTERDAQDHGVIVNMPEQGADAPVDADPQLLHVVIYNLVINAIEAAAAGTSKCPSVAVELQTAPGLVHVTVTDTGPGVSPAMLPRLFEPFESGKASGVGIGLALARRIAEAHGGHLTLLSNEQGATFRLSLARSEA